ncbi:hypothetical protein [Amycolatopsis pithecellobii]|uniref:Uncharacterized protein n=1 Tax=Amycolatopsis pithecellobii TaxID=664692 RepID=A0A6N7Z874_9PSEU|nr:hypothetical protein [Amycolatopsis pithecellobii]MTD56516.1 hypothetical protein [Amycolatopsis pithecellobii]
MTPDELADEHFRLLTTDSRVRGEFVTDPESALKRHFGYLPDGDHHVESIDERPGLITILIPPLPADPGETDVVVSEVSERIFDLLHTDIGIGGYLIPDVRLTWVLRDMRSNWLRLAAERAGADQ